MHLFTADFHISKQFSFLFCSIPGPLASGLVSYEMVAHLFSVLTSPHLESEDRLSVLLTLCHCTDASGDNTQQCVLKFQCCLFYGKIVFIGTQLWKEQLYLYYYCALVPPVCRGASVPVGAVWRSTPYYNPAYRGFKWGGQEGCYFHTSDVQTGQ